MFGDGVVDEAGPDRSIRPSLAVDLKILRTENSKARKYTQLPRPPQPYARNPEHYTPPDKPMPSKA